MIEIKNVSKEFEKQDQAKKRVSFLADDDITLSVNEGEIVGILGPNGAGKTTLLRIIAGIMKPTKGSVLIDGDTYLKNDIKIKRKISFLSGNTRLYKDISPFELLMMCAEYYGVTRDEAKKRINEIASEFDLNSFINQKIENLSTGQLQRVNIARCIIHSPKYYIFDEATSGLDIISSKVILDFIKKEKENKKGIIYSTHYMEEAENICDKVFLVHKGKVVASGTPKEIIKETKTSNLRDAFFAIIGGGVHE